MTWLDMAVEIAKQFEGCSLDAYPDPVHGWKVPTIGYGATGPSIAQGTIWTQQQCDDDLSRRMVGMGEIVDRQVTVDLNDEPKAALCDFTYNEGEGNLSRSSLLEKLNAGDIQGAADEFGKWDLAGGEELEGLDRRRSAEKALFLLGSNFAAKEEVEPEVQS
jgi:lysozyme